MLELRHLVDKYNLTGNQLVACYDYIKEPYCITYCNAEGQVLRFRGHIHRPTLEEALQHIDKTCKIKFPFSTATITYQGSDDIEDWNKPIIVVAYGGEILLGKELFDKVNVENLDVLKIA